MKKTFINYTLLGGLLIASSSVMATGFVTLNPNGFAAPGGTSAYTLCNTSGNFGQGVSIPPYAAGSTGTVCAVPSHPVSGYTQVANAVRTVTHNGVSVARITDRVWRSGTSCIYGAKIHLYPVEYAPGQSFEANDFLRAGFRNRGSISIAYYWSATTDEAVYRAGLTLTSKVTPPNPKQPLTSSAPISTNWVDFTSDLNSEDPDGSTKPDSSWMYVKSTCTTAVPTALAGAIQIRQMGQEGQPIIFKSIPGFAPTGSNTAP